MVDVIFEEVADIRFMQQIDPCQLVDIVKENEEIIFSSNIDEQLMMIQSRSPITILRFDG